MPRGHEHDSIYLLRIYARFSDQFFFKFSMKKIATGKKIDCCAVFGWNNVRIFLEKYTVMFLFAQKARVNTERVPPGHAIRKGKGAHEPKAHTAGAYFQFP